MLHRGRGDVKGGQGEVQGEQGEEWVGRGGTECGGASPGGGRAGGRRRRATVVNARFRAFTRALSTTLSLGLDTFGGWLVPGWSMKNASPRGSACRARCTTG